MIESSVDRSETNLTVIDTPDFHQSHHLENTCLKIFISHFNLQMNFDNDFEDSGVWEGVFYLKDLEKIKMGEVANTLACLANSLFRILYKEAQCQGNPAISFRLSFKNESDNETQIKTMFVLSIMNEDGKEEIPSETLDERAISHSYAYISNDLSSGTLSFFFNDPQVVTLEKIMSVISQIIQPQPEVHQTWMDSIYETALPYFYNYCD
jgi:hypothetical protein